MNLRGRKLPKVLCLLAVIILALVLVNHFVIGSPDMLLVEPLEQEDPVVEHPEQEEPTEPPPEESGFIEKQVGGQSYDPLGIVWIRLGQRLVIPNRKVLTLAFCLQKIGDPTGDVTFAIRDLEGNIIVSEVLGDASIIDVKRSWYEVTFSSPKIIDEEVRLSCEWGPGDKDNHLGYMYRTGNPKPGEWYTNYYAYGQWHDIGEAEEGNYKYTYTLD